MTLDYDVVVAGASVAGCASAILLASQGARVALLEKRTTVDAYKVLCTHTLQPGCMPVLKTIGLLPLLEEVGARTHVTQLWTPWGWISPEAELLLSAAARNATAARHHYQFASRLIDIKHYASPGSLLRAARINVMHQLRSVL